MAVGAQYGEDEFLQEFFKDQEKGFIVDVGAADGKDNSNSYQLLKRPAWGAVLVEPEPSQFAQLIERYHGRFEKIRCVKNAVGTVPGIQTLHCGLQVSTLLQSWREQCEKAYGIDYTMIDVDVKTLTSILIEQHAPSEIDFLSIDCEGADWDVFCSLDLDLFKPRLVCLEGHHYTLPGYDNIHNSHGNSFHARTN